jgi:sulfite exporter TauE/SafE
MIYFIGRKTIHLKMLNRFYFFVQQQISKLLKSVTGAFGFLLMGMANGLLPCGMVYVALAATLSFTRVIESMSFMAMFGAGTLPAMMLVGYAGQLIKPAWRNSFRKLVPVFISVMGVVLILRGLNLGIPFISPELPMSPGNTIICHP